MGGTGLDTALLGELVESAARSHGLLLVDLSWFQSGRRGILRILVDRPGRVTVGECAALSRAVDDLIDREMLITGPYLLEVGSPGVGRKLSSEADWIRCVGRRLRVETESETIEDELLAWEGGCLVFPGDRIVPVAVVRRAVEVLETGSARGTGADAPAHQ